MGASHLTQVRSDHACTLFVPTRRLQVTPFTSKRKRTALLASFQTRLPSWEHHARTPGVASGQLNASQTSIGTTSQEEEEYEEEDAEWLPVRIRTKHSVSFGQIIRTVGAGEALGDWNADQAPGMTWSEGDEWAVDLYVPAGSYNFKCVVTRQDGSIVEWEPGENRVFEVPDPEQSPGQILEVVCPWSNTSATFLSYDEDDATARLESQQGEAIQASSGTNHQKNPAADIMSDGLNSLDEEQSSSDQDLEETLDAVAEAIQSPQNGPESSTAATSNTAQLEPSLEKQIQQSQTSPNSNGSQPSQKPAPVQAQAQPSTVSAKEEPKLQVDDNLQVASSSTDRASESTDATLRGVQESNDVPPPSTSDQGGGAPFAQGLVGFLGLLAVPIVFFSEYALKETGCGLPPGPSGYIGAAEGVSYLAIGGLAGWAFFSRVLGKGFPRGPGGLLGAAESLSYAAVVLGAVVLGFQYKDYGYIPSALPDSNCFGNENSRGEDFYASLPFSLPGEDFDAGESMSIAMKNFQNIFLNAPDAGESMSSAVKNFQNIFMNGPESSMEYVASGAQDGLSSADLEPVVEELERAAARIGDWLNSLKQRLTPTPTPVALSSLPTLQPLPQSSIAAGQQEWDVAVSPAAWQAIVKGSPQPADSNPPLRLVGMEMSFNVAATNAASAANNVTQNINNEVLQLDSAATSLAETSKKIAEVPAAAPDSEEHVVRKAIDGLQDALQQVKDSSDRLQPMIHELQATADELRTDSSNSARVEALDKASESLTRAVNVETPGVPEAKSLVNGKLARVKDEGKVPLHAEMDAHVSRIQTYLEEAVEVLGSLAAQEQVSPESVNVP